MKLLPVCCGVVSMFFAATSVAFAAPFKSAEHNPLVVAYYPDGPHGVVSEPEGNHEGQDLVLREGKTWTFQQWSYGTLPATGEGVHGDHDIWMPSKDGTCPKNTTMVLNAQEEWGDYLQPNTTYCVRNNDFHLAK